MVEVPIALVIVIVALTWLALDLSSLRWGVDTRDGDDWIDHTAR